MNSLFHISTEMNLSPRTTPLLRQPFLFDCFGVILCHEYVLVDGIYIPLLLLLPQTAGGGVGGEVCPFV